MFILRDVMNNKQIQSRVDNTVSLVQCVQKRDEMCFVISPIKLMKCGAPFPFFKSAGRESI